MPRHSIKFCWVAAVIAVRRGCEGLIQKTIWDSPGVGGGREGRG